MSDWRNDEDWASSLATDDIAQREEAVRDLRDMLYRGLAKSLSTGGRIDDAFLDDVVQEATMKILEKLHDFEGRSKFRTWAVTIAVRAAVNRMRKRDWQNVSLESVVGEKGFAASIVIESDQADSYAKSRLELLGKLKDLIDTELTEKQRTALAADLGGMPLPQIADKLGSNTNSIYKLLHDARKKLRRGFETAGVTIDDVREAWG